MLQRATVDGDSGVAPSAASFDCSAATTERISSIRRQARIAHSLNSSIDCVSARVLSIASICELRAASSAWSSSSSDWLEPTALSTHFARIVIPKYGYRFVTTIRVVIMNQNAPSLDRGLASPPNVPTESDRTAELIVARRAVSFETSSTTHRRRSNLERNHP